MLIPTAIARGELQDTSTAAPHELDPLPSGGLALADETRHVLRPLPEGRAALLAGAETFDFSAVQDFQSTSGGGDLPGSVTASDLSWVHHPALEGGHIEASLPDLVGHDTDMFDFHSLDMIGAVQLAAIDQAAALGADGMRVA